jgi:hypothetical protein
MHEGVSMHDEQNDRREQEEGKQWQFDVEERQLYRAPQQEVGVRDRARRNG